MNKVKISREEHLKAYDEEFRSTGKGINAHRAYYAQFE